MRSRSTYLSIAVLLVLIAGVVWQRSRQNRQADTLQQRRTSLTVADAGAIDHITLQQGTSTVELAQTGNGWLVASAGNVPAETSAVDALLKGFAQIRVLSVAAAADSDLDPVGLSEPERFGLTLSGNGQILQQFWIGRPPSSFGSAYLLPVGGREVYLVESVPYDLFSRTDWRDKAILRVPVADIQEIKYQRGRTKFTLARNSGEWLLDGKPARNEVAQLFADNLANLNAMEILPPDTKFTPIDITIGLTLNDRQMELRLGKAPRDDEAYLKTSDGKLYWLANTNRTRLTRERKEFVP